MPPVAWNVASLRATAFVPGLTTEIARSWWPGIIPDAPEEVVEKRRDGLFLAQGAFGSGSLRLAISPGRSDWQLGPTSGPDSEGFNFVGTVDASLAQFVPLIEAWLKVVPPVKRLAFGAELLSPVDSIQAGYRVLAELLQDSVRLDVENSSDFIYTINRPRPSATLAERDRINRLSKWFVLRSATVAVSVAAGAGATISPESLAIRLELDISTSPNRETHIPEELLPTVFGELVSMGTEIARTGDKP